MARHSYRLCADRIFESYHISRHIIRWTAFVEGSDWSIARSAEKVDVRTFLVHGLGDCLRFRGRKPKFVCFVFHGFGVLIGALGTLHVDVVRVLTRLVDLLKTEMKKKRKENIVR